MFNSLNLDQYVPGNSRLHALDPRSKIIGTIALLLAIFNASFPGGFIIMILASFVLIGISKINWRWYLNGIKPFLFLIILTMLCQTWFTPATGYIDLYGWKFSNTGIITGLILSMRLILVLLISRLLTTTTTPMSITAGLEKVMNPLQRLKFPVHELIMIMTLSLRFIPLYIEEAQRIRKAQLCRGGDPGQGSLPQRFNRLMALIIPLIRISLQRCTELTDAMESRAYSGGQGRTHMYELKMNKLDYVYILVLTGLAMGIIGGRF